MKVYWCYLNLADRRKIIAKLKSLPNKLCIRYSSVIGISIPYVTVQAKTSLVHTSKFATLVLYNFGWERSTELKFAMLVH